MDQADCKSAVAGMRHGRFDPCPSHVTSKVVDLSDEKPSLTEITQMTVNLLAGSKAAMEGVAKIKAMSQTDVVNKALVVYLMVMMTEDIGAEYFIKREDGSYEPVVFSKM